MPHRTDSSSAKTEDSVLAGLYESSLRRSADVSLATIDACRDAVASAVAQLVQTYRDGGTVFFCGNGGSAADAQHLATEMMIRLGRDVKRPALGAVSLATDTSNLTAGGNDIGFDNVFARNIEGLGRSGDSLVAISTSGNSPNVLAAVQKAQALGLSTVALTGGSGGQLRTTADVAIVIPSDDVQHIQETHITVGHILCQAIEQTLYPING